MGGLVSGQVGHWMSDLPVHEADAIIASTHSQGSFVSTHLLNRCLVQDNLNHITTPRIHDGSTNQFWNSC